MHKGKLVYIDENGNCFTTRQIACDMRPVPGSCGMHIVNFFRYGGFGSVFEFECFVQRFVKQYEFRKSLSAVCLKQVLPGADGIADLSDELDPDAYCYVIQEKTMTIYCGKEPAETVYRRTDLSEPPLGENEFVSILETLKNDAEISMPVQDLIINLLELLMRDWGSEISCYVYDLDFGRRDEPGLFSDREGKVDLSCGQALYRDLVQTQF